jgi:hypothetical protein
MNNDLSFNPEPVLEWVPGYFMSFLWTFNGLSPVKLTIDHYVDPLSFN